MRQADRLVGDGAVTHDPRLPPEIAALVTPLGEDELRQLLPPDVTPWSWSTLADQVRAYYGATELDVGQEQAGAFRWGLRDFVSVYRLAAPPELVQLFTPGGCRDVCRCADVPRLVGAARVHNRRVLAAAVDAIFDRLLAGPDLTAAHYDLPRVGTDNVEAYNNYWTVLATPHFGNCGAFPFHLPFCANDVVYLRLFCATYRTRRDDWLYDLAVGRLPPDAVPVTPRRLTLEDLERGEKP